MREFATAAARQASRYEYRLADLAPDTASPTRGVDGAARLATMSVDSVLKDPSAIVVWHDLGFDPVRSFAVRSHSGGRYPLTFTHHTLSYGSLVQDSYLPLLLQRPLCSDAIVCTSVAARDALAKILEHVASSFEEAYGVDIGYRGQLAVIPLGVDTGRFRPLDAGECRAKYGISAQAFVLLWAGRLSAIDKADLLPLMPVLASLRRRNSPRELLLVCAGTEYPEEAYTQTLRSFAAAWGVGDSLRILVDAAIGPELYGCADVFVSPIDNIQETFGLTPIEAMACGIPQVVSDWNGYRDTVADGVTGFRLPTLWASCATDLIERWYLDDDARNHAVLGQSVAVDVEALELRLQQLIADPPMRQAMASASRARALAEYDWAVVLAKHEALWSELASTPPAPPHAPVFQMRKLHYTDVFGHYASRMLDGHEALSLTPLATQGAGSRAPLRADLRGIIEPAVLSRVVGLLSSATAAGGTLTAGELVGTLCQELGLPPPRLLRHLLWLAKHGWVSIQGR
ncbi:MAG: glycosyltransferase family 4 protein [Polyangiaceae bacterium]|nr:glycosyltransferase family 4 protein [Polyangiaceae bacterium]